MYVSCMLVYREEGTLEGRQKLSWVYLHCVWEQVRRQNGRKQVGDVCIVYISRKEGRKGCRKQVEYECVSRQGGRRAVQEAGWKVKCAYFPSRRLFHLSPSCTLVRRLHTHPQVVSNDSDHMASPTRWLKLIHLSEGVVTVTYCGRRVQRSLPRDSWRLPAQLYRG